MSQLKADISPPLKKDIFDPSPLRHPFLTPQSDWAIKAANERRYLQRTLFLGFSKFKITARRPMGQAELLRMLFHYSGIPFEDELLPEADWKSLMCKMPHGNLPVLWMDHNVYGEMNVIVRHLARHLFLMGRTEAEELTAESVLQQVQELKESDVVQKAYEELKYRPDDNVEQLFEVLLPSRFVEWEQHIKSSGGPFLLASGISLPDMAIFDFISQYSKYLPIENAIVPYTLLQQHFLAIMNHTGFKSYFQAANAIRLYE